MNNQNTTLVDVIYDLLSKRILIPDEWIDTNSREFKMNPEFKTRKAIRRNIPMNINVAMVLTKTSDEHNIEIVEIELLIEMEVFTSMLDKLETVIELYFDGYDWGVSSYYDETQSVGELREIYSREDLSIIHIEYEKPNMRRENKEYVEGVMDEALYILSVLNS